MRSLLLIALSGLLVVLEKGDAFFSHPLIVRQTVKHQSGGRKSVNIGNIVASASRQGPSSDLPPQQKAWLPDLMASWFKLPPPDGSAAKANTKESMGATATEDVRATIRELRDSNDELRAEVLALRTYMLQRGFTPVEDVFADPSSQKPAALLSPTASPPATTTTDLSLFQPTSITPPPPPPPPALPREARLAALALLWAAAISIGGVFVPVAIREGAGRSLRWLDGGGSLIPAPVRRVLSGYRGRWRGRGWGNAVLSYVPVLARATKAAGETGGDGKEGGREEQGEGLVGAWDELKPRRRRSSSRRRRRTP